MMRSGEIGVDRLEKGYSPRVSLLQSPTYKSHRVDVRNGSMNREEILVELARSVETWNVPNAKKYAQMAMD